MKRKVIATVLGIAASAAMSSAFAQGSVYFQNYYLNALSSLIPVAPVTLASNGQYVGANFTADLLYSLNNGASYTDAGVAEAFYGAGGVSGSPLSDGSGLFAQEQVTIASYTGGAVYFEVEAYNGATYATSTIRGISAPAIVSSISQGVTPPATFLADNSLATTPLAGFSVSAVPEPTTLALVGLGGLASLVALRRKQA